MSRRAAAEQDAVAAEMARFRARVLRLVALIPRGRVATYGQISVLAGHPRRARHVGNALRANRDDALPWHRVLNAQGRVSARHGETRPRGDVQVEHLQQRRLAAEGVTFTRGRVDLERYRWRPETEGARLQRGLRGKR
jgi:methylated-DNA-protein-cysteine methyltransferase related protein